MKKDQLGLLVQLATIDNELAGTESEWIQKIGSSLGLNNEEIEEVFRRPNSGPLQFFSEEERFENLYNLIQLMKIDGRIFYSEIDFCRKAAEKLGFHPGVVKELSSGIYGDPSITSDRSRLFKKALKYLKPKAGL